MKASPNILIILSDQLNARMVGAYGSLAGKTPAVDSIANRGVRFTNAYTNCPLCQPARASLWTGLYPHQTGVLGNGGIFAHRNKTVTSDIPSVGSIFSAAGYNCIHFGKQHDKGALHGFECIPVEPLEVDAESPAWPLNGDTFRDEDTTNKVVRFLSKSTEKPFVCIADLENPHNICGWVGEHQGPHIDTPIQAPLPQLPMNFYCKDFENRSLPFKYLSLSHERLRQANGWNEKNYRHYIAAYHHYVSRMDQCVERILHSLYSTSAGENTLVVFLSDHGDACAEHGMVTKNIMFYDCITRVPLIFAGPGVPRENTAIQTPTHLIDILPTLCEYAGLKSTEQGRYGKSLLPFFRQKHTSWQRECIVSEWHTAAGHVITPGRMIRTERYKYIRYLEADSEELYDMLEDPMETGTLHKEPEFAPILEKHRHILRRVVEHTNDPFFSLPIEVESELRKHRPQSWNNRSVLP